MYSLKENFGDPYVYVNAVIDDSIDIGSKFIDNEHFYEVSKEELDENELEELVNRTFRGFWEDIADGIKQSGLVLDSYYDDGMSDWGPMFYCAPGDESKLAEYIKDYFNCDLSIFDYTDYDEIRCEDDSWGFASVSVTVSCAKFNGVKIDRD